MKNKWIISIVLVMVISLSAGCINREPEGIYIDPTTAIDFEEAVTNGNNTNGEDQTITDFQISETDSEENLPFYRIGYSDYGFNRQGSYVGKVVDEAIEEPLFPVDMELFEYYRLNEERIQNGTFSIYDDYMAMSTIGRLDLIVDREVFTIDGSINKVYPDSINYNGGLYTFDTDHQKMERLYLTDSKSEEVGLKVWWDGITYVYPSVSDETLIKAEFLENPFLEIDLINGSSLEVVKTQPIDDLLTVVLTADHQLIILEKSVEEEGYQIKFKRTTPVRDFALMNEGIVFTGFGQQSYLRFLRIEDHKIFKFKDMEVVNDVDAIGDYISYITDDNNFHIIKAAGYDGLVVECESILDLTDHRYGGENFGQESFCMVKGEYSLFYNKDLIMVYDLGSGELVKEIEGTKPVFKDLHTLVLINEPMAISHNLESGEEKVIGISEAYQSLLVIEDQVYGYIGDGNITDLVSQKEEFFTKADYTLVYDWGTRTQALFLYDNKENKLLTLAKGVNLQYAIDESGITYRKTDKEVLDETFDFIPIEAGSQVDYYMADRELTQTDLLDYIKDPATDSDYIYAREDLNTILVMYPGDDYPYLFRYDYMGKLSKTAVNYSYNYMNLSGFDPSSNEEYVASVSGKDGDRELVIIDLVRGEILETLPILGDYVWSPDGDRIAFETQGQYTFTENNHIKNNSVAIYNLRTETIEYTSEGTVTTFLKIKEWTKDNLTLQLIDENGSVKELRRVATKEEIMVDTSLVYGVPEEVLTESIRFVKAYIDAQLVQNESNDLKIEEVVITDIKYTNSFIGDNEQQVWELNFKYLPEDLLSFPMADGMVAEDGFITSHTSMGQPYLVFEFYMGDMTYVGNMISEGFLDLPFTYQENMVWDLLNQKNLVKENRFSTKHKLVLQTQTNGDKIWLLMSKPVDQGELGIWCVERIMDVHGSVYYPVPKADISIMKVYEERQLESNIGEDTTYRDVIMTARKMYENSFETVSSVSEYEDLGEVSISEFNQGPMAEYEGFIVDLPSEFDHIELVRFGETEGIILRIGETTVFEVIHNNSYKVLDIQEFSDYYNSDKVYEIKYQNGECLIIREKLEN